MKKFFRLIVLIIKYIKVKRKIARLEGLKKTLLLISNSLEEEYMGYGGACPICKHKMLNIGSITIADSDSEEGRNKVSLICEKCNAILVHSENMLEIAINTFRVKP